MPRHVGVLIVLLFAIGCSSDSPGEVRSGANNANTLPAKIKIKSGDGSTAFAIKRKDDGAKVVRGEEAEWLRLTRTKPDKLKVKDASDTVLGYITGSPDALKIKNAAQDTVWFKLSRQPDGDYKLKDGQDQSRLTIKKRDYGYEVENASGYCKAKRKGDKLSLRNQAEETVYSTKDPMATIAMACLGFDAPEFEPWMAMALAVRLATESSATTQESK